jgi:hypothetical protein
MKMTTLIRKAIITGWVDILANRLSRSLFFTKIRILSRFAPAKLIYNVSKSRDKRVHFEASKNWQ